MSGKPGANPVAELLTPLEEALLEALPQEGLRLGYAWLAPSVADLKAQLGRGLARGAQPTSTAISGGLKRLQYRSFVAQKSLGGRGVGYQRTAAGLAEAARLGLIPPITTQGDLDVRDN